ncbi:MAG TPA: hypothetical protein VF112_04100 [Candidatus Dormibacteraeota bacterium]
MSYVLRLDQMPTSGYTAAVTPRAVNPSTIYSAAADVTALRTAGMGGAATARYLQPAPVLATANGPLDVVASVIVFSGVSGAHQGMQRLTAQVDARPGIGQVSAGDLGAESHATTQTATASDGTVVVEITVLWRVANLLNEVVVRGRQGATGVGDAVIIANRQAGAER